MLTVTGTVHYRTIKEEQDRTISYGIEAVCENVRICCISGVAANGKEVERLVEAMNRRGIPIWEFNHTVQSYILQLTNH